LVKPVTPKRFAGLGITFITKRAESTVPYAQGMLIGSAGILAYCVVSLYLIQRLHALVGSILAWLAWFAVVGGLYLAFGR
jgi:hypothetical protein